MAHSNGADRPDERLDAKAGARIGERAGVLPEDYDAGLYFIGRIRTPWASRKDCPRQGDAEAGPLCSIELDPRWQDALLGLEPGWFCQVLYFMDEARRDLLVQVPRGGTARGTFALRSPARLNPIASSIVQLIGVEGAVLTVRGLDCRDGTPLVDLKPWRKIHGQRD
jgi:tRNA-Thr(GGU) m(6)t(6)A37 methyltransferase TsaA